MAEEVRGLVEGWRKGLREGYGWQGFRADLIAGLTVGAVALPQAMAYALIAGIPPVYGVYTAIVMTALGSVFGSSSHLINGPTNALSLVTFSAVGGLALHDADKNLQAVFFLALLVGALQILIFSFKLGDLTRYISESVVLGFMLGASFLIGLGQLPNLLGLHGTGETDQHLLLRLWRTLTEGGPIRPHALLLGGGTVLVVTCLRQIGNRLKMPLPDMLGGLVLASLAGTALGWREEWPAFPATLPSFHIPQFEMAWLRPLSGSALALAILGLLEALAIAKSIAARTRQPLDYNWQCLAEGLANLGGGLFQCMPGSGSLTRSAINFQAGAGSRMSGVISALAVAVSVLLFADLARYVPRPALAGILLVTAWRLIDRRRVIYCFRASSYDGWVAGATTLSAVFISIEFSILIGVFLSFLLFVPRAAKLRTTELVVGKERVVRERQPDDPPCGKLAVFSLEGELFFGAAPELDHFLTDLAARTRQGVGVIVLRLKRTRNPDMVCLECLHRFLEEMKGQGVPVFLCGVREDFARALDRLGFAACLPPENVFREEDTSGAALSSTIQAVRRAYEVLGEDLCTTCPRRQELEAGGWYYMI